MARPAAPKAEAGTGDARRFSQMPKLVRGASGAPPAPRPLAGARHGAGRPQARKEDDLPQR
eukprot:2764418-Pyramimonas_sp.AAC.1